MKHNMETVKFMKVPVSVTIEKRLVEWVDEEVKSLRFRNRSHAFEVAINELLKASEKNKR